MMGWYGSGMGYGGWLSTGLVWFALLGVIIWAVARLLPSRREVGRGPAAPETQEDVLDRRFARGEIDLVSYQEQRSALVQARSESKARS